MKAEIKEYCIRCGICVGLYPQLFAHNFEKDCIDVNMMRFRRNWKRLQKMQPETVR